jgi:hypothetical protein
MILLKIFLILLGLLLGILIPKIWLTLNLRLTDSARTGSARVQLAGKLIGVLVKVDWPEVNVKGGIGGLYFSVWSRQPSKITVKKKPAEPPKTEKPKTKKQSKHTTGDWVGFGKTIIVRIFKIPKIERFRADLTIGLGNPAYTGFAIGAYYALKPTLKALRSVKIEPDFIKKKINGEIEFCGSIRLIKTIPLIILTLRFLWKK